MGALEILFIIIIMTAWLPAAFRSGSARPTDSDEECLLLKEIETDFEHNVVSLVTRLLFSSCYAEGGSGGNAAGTVTMPFAVRATQSSSTGPNSSSVCIGVVITVTDSFGAAGAEWQYRTAATPPQHRRRNR